MRSGIILLVNSELERFFIDVDGVMTKAFFGYSKNGKKLKFFSADDHEAIILLSSYLKIFFVSADARGFKITKRRIVKDMGQSLTLVPARERLNWIKKFGDLRKSVYMGDSFTDIEIMKKIGYGISVADSNKEVQKYCKYVTSANGGERAVSEACIHLLTTLYNVEI